MGKFADLDEYFDPGLTLTVRGREYVLPLPSAELGLWCRRMAQAGAEIHAASSDKELQTAVDQASARFEALPHLPGDLSFEERLLGPVYAALTADGVPDPYVQMCAQTAYIWIIGGEDAAERYWTSGGRPEALSPAQNRAERRAQARTGRTSTGGAATTRTPASTSGTTSRRTSSGSRRRSGSPGRRSSATGG